MAGNTKRTWCGMMLLLLATWLPARAGDTAVAQGALQDPVLLASRYVPERRIRVWLPPGYAGTDARYPVLYMHDGQHAFAAGPPSSSGFGSWEADLAMARLIASGDIRAAIVVAIDNTSNRTGEYMPQAAYRLAQSRKVPVGTSRGTPLDEADVQSDNYLKFIVEELKPYIDTRYRTARGRDDTFVMGSSMGGLISLYAISEYPQVFGGAACLSTHWPIGDGVAVDHARTRLPDPRSHRLYFDRGTETLDVSYVEHQDEVDRILEARGYVLGRNAESRVFEGAAHDEKSWAKRLAIPLRFLLGDDH